MQATPSPFVYKEPVTCWLGVAMLRRGWWFCTSRSELKDAFSEASPALEWVSSEGTGWEAKRLWVLLWTPGQSWQVALIKWGALGGKKGFFFCLLAAGSLVSYTPGTMALNSCCALSKAAVIFTLMCVDGFLLSLLHSSLWKWHLWTQNTDNYSHILWESLIWLKAWLAFPERSCFFSPKTHFALLSCSHH